MAVIYIDEEAGSDLPEVQGTESAPYKTIFEAFFRHGAESEYQVKKKGDEEYKPAAKSALKKATNYAAQQKKKLEAAAKRAEKEAQEEAAREAVLEEAKKIQIVNDPSLPEPVRINLGEIDAAVIGVLRKSKDEPAEGVKRVSVQGRVQRVAKQGGLIFVTLRRGLNQMQCLLSGDLSKTYDALTLTRETSMEIIGELWEVPAGAHAPLDRELRADYFKIIARAPGGDDAFTNQVPLEGDTQTLLNMRHLTLRHEKPAAIMFVRDVIESAFHTTYKELDIKKVSPPALVQTQVEGGATLFKFDYYGETSYLTQSSQLYLETVLPVLGDVYCIEKSFRAEKSLTRRHLSEYTHVEAELDFITFDDLLSHLEHVICRVIDLALENPIAAEAIKKYNPEFKKPERPFMRMRYSDAIDWLRERGIKNEEGNDHTFGDDIAEAAERKMTDEINRPIFLTHFPVEIKSFYMQRAEDDPRVTESVDCLMPGVGEIVGGSMRIWDWEELMAGYKREGIDPTGYFWYTDQRKYGSTPHGGYGLGAERFLAWLLKLWTVREACLYPRFMGRCTP
ncbi:Asparagine--tRNA ligase [Fusarium keratoplasticum]|uniref:Asparagine--tRNA ligase n=1 Tax=Fusarium keratoplasticum TaxID=1328300 RepID=A0ACC0R6P5_9HYPO|nr:Asparagine--tRNA ligase [Fusarium keratoplasticum]KAI8675364.1 Asparagine--tRNA ligase [Fusarium keratoplasticum]KAI8681809.1 Asparagine--tRNA ligase [Fusarium keratoplasticum]